MKDGQQWRRWRSGTTQRSVLLLAVFGTGVSLAGQQPAQPAAPVCPQGNATQVRNGEGKLVPDARCASAGPPPSAAGRFPFPGETPTAVPDPSPAAPATAPGSPAAAATPNAPAGKRFPYPGESGEASPAGEGAGGNPPSGGASGPPLEDKGSSGTSGSSSSTSSSSSKDQDRSGNDDSDPDDPTAVPRFKRRKMPAVPHQSASEREEEDVRVAGFYQNDGNFAGAYARAKDAVSLDAEDPAAHLALGEAARRLGKLDEADKAFRRCLDLDPIPKQRKAAERALKEMTGGS